MGQLGGDWQFLLAEMPKGATVKPPFCGDKPGQRDYASRGVFKLGYGEPFLNIIKSEEDHFDIFDTEIDNLATSGDSYLSLQAIDRSRASGTSSSHPN